MFVNSKDQRVQRGRASRGRSRSTFAAVVIGAALVASILAAAFVAARFEPIDDADDDSSSFYMRAMAGDDLASTILDELGDLL